MLLAIARFDVAACVSAAVTMAKGGTRGHERPELCHDAGYGMVYRVAGTEELRIYRSSQPIWTDPACHQFDNFDLDVLAIHCRNCIDGLVGPEHVHPRRLDTSNGTWSLMHNGALPQLAGALGLDAMPLDTDNYLRLAVELCVGPSPVEILRELDRYPGGTSANAFFLHQRRVIVINDFPVDSPHPRFYTLSTLTTNGGLIVASEPCPNLAHPTHWTELGRRHGFEIHLDQPFPASIKQLEKTHD